MKRLFVAALAAYAALAQTPGLLEKISAHLTANALKADVSFLASDALLGRGTPSPGLDIAAEYVAAQFRRAGLEAAGDDGYFQTAAYVQVSPNVEGLQLTLDMGGQTITPEKASLGLQDAAPVDLSHAAAFKMTLTDPAADALTADQVRGKVLIVEVPDPPAQAAGGRGGGGAMMAMRRVPAAAEKLGASLVILVRSSGQATNMMPRLREADVHTVPVIVVWDAGVRKATADLKPGPVEATISAHVAAPASTPVKLRNVIGILRGSDAALKDTYVMLTAHYDHLGVRGTGPGDHLYNGANDDASGTASVIEIANAFAALPEKPKRSIVFVTFFGEEVGELGSHYYGRHPVLALAKTVADINLEQLGRTDERGEGEKLAQFNLTGFDYTNIAAIFRVAGEQTGVKVVKDEKKNEPYFTASDNAALAEVGVPSTTISVTYAFSDYHQPGDEWPKLNYDNMAQVDRTIALGAWAMANSAEAPQWDAANPKTAPFVKARQAGK